MLIPLFLQRAAAIPAASLVLAAALACTTSGCLSNTLAPGAAEGVLRQQKSVTVYAAGDIAECRKHKPEYSVAAKTAALIARALNADSQAHVLALGDLTYPIGVAQEYNDCYEPTWGRFKERTYPAPGNHEYYTPEAIGYYGYFGEAAGPGRRGYYSVEIGSWHVVSLNSNLKPAQRQAQLDWLKKDLEQYKGRCTLAFWHHPLYSSGGHGNNAWMADAWKLLMDHGADLVLSGHDHDYERFAPQDEKGNRDEGRGMREFVVGTGGAHLTPMRFRKPNSETSGNSAHGVLKLTLKEAGYEWEFLPVEAGGLTDRGAALCH